MIITPRLALAPLNTLRLGGYALAEIRLDTSQDCEHLSAALAQTGGIPCVLGGGSNLLIHDGELPITVLRPMFGAHDTKPEILGEEDVNGAQRILLRVGAGTPMPRLLAWCASKGLSGLEGLVGLPSRLGGAVAMNAGAYGCSMAYLLRSISVFTPEKGLHTLSPEGWNARYRHFSLTEPCAWYMNVSAVLSLSKDKPEAVRARMRKNFLLKKASQPVHEHTAGCVFQNPKGESAGKLLDMAGMKGKRRGALYFSPLHANFLVHDTRCGTEGTSEDALALIAAAKRAVRDNFGMELQMEVKEWPPCHS